MAISSGTMATTVDGTIISIALPTMARDLRVQASSVVFIITIYLLVQMMTVLPLSGWGDRIGHRRLYAGGLLLFVVASIGCAFSRSFPMLVAARSAQALGAAATLSVSSALIRAVYPPEQLGRGLGINTVVASASATIAPMVGGAILGIAAWPWLFAVVAPIGLFAAVAGRAALPDAHVRVTGYDLRGAIMCAATFGIFVSGLELVVGGGHAAQSALLVASGVALGWRFIRWELKQQRPILPVDLLRTRMIALPAAALLAGFFAQSAVLILLPFRLQQQYGYSAMAAGAVLAPMPLASMVFGAAGSFLSDRLSPGLLGAAGMVVAIAGLLLLAALPSTPGAFDVTWRVALCGIGFGAFASPVARILIGAAPPERAASAGALGTTIRGIGQTLGATAVAALFAAGAGASAVPMLLTAGIALLAGLCSFETTRPAKRSYGALTR